MRIIAAILPVLLATNVTAHAAPLHVAAASNFQRAMKELASAYEEKSGHEIVISFGATGRLFAQILNGAPYQVFLAADAKRPARLEALGRAVPGSRFTYAVGRLSLCGTLPGLRNAGLKILEREGSFRIAMANPRLAPYGRAARQVLERLRLLPRLRGRIVTGENIGQTFHFVVSGAAPLGFVARSQAVSKAAAARLSCIPVPQELHRPVLQQAVMVKDTRAARDFLAFLRSPRAASIMQRHGYLVPK